LDKARQLAVGQLRNRTGICGDLPQLIQIDIRSHRYGNDDGVGGRKARLDPVGLDDCGLGIVHTAVCQHKDYLVSVQPPSGLHDISRLDQPVECVRLRRGGRHLQPLKGARHAADIIVLIELPLNVAEVAKEHAGHVRLRGSYWYLDVEHCHQLDDAVDERLPFVGGKARVVDDYHQVQDVGACWRWLRERLS